MNLDNLLDSLGEASTDPVVVKLCEYIVEWKTSQATASDLRESVERFIGNTWILREDEHKLVYRLWSTFRDDAVEGLPRMPMNERLSAFSLSERYDAESDEGTKARILAKLGIPEVAKK
jgi:hypothetical protein